MITAIFVPTTSDNSLDTLMIVIHQRGHHRIEVVIHLLLADQVALQFRILVIPSALWQIFHQLAP